MTLRELVEMAHANAKEKGFHDKENPVPQQLMLIVTEVAEAMEDYRNGHMSAAYEGLGGSRTHKAEPPPFKPVGFPTEIADILIRAADLCGALGIDLQKAVEEKMRYNRSRPRMHGKGC